MLSGYTQIQWIDTNKKITQNNTISKLFQSYVERTENGFDQTLGVIIDEINFDETDGLKVKDWYGWTSVIKIIRYYKCHGRLCLIENNENSLPINENGIFPVYDPNNPIKGFHGEIKFPYEVKNVTSLKNGDYARFISYNYESEELKDFTKIQILYYHESLDDLYWIITKSGFFNANKFHLACNKLDNSKENFK